MSLFIDKIPSNYVCNYEVNLLYNNDFNEMIYLSLQKSEDVRVGISYKNKINGGNSIRDLG